MTGNEMGRANARPVGACGHLAAADERRVQLGLRCRGEHGRSQRGKADGRNDAGRNLEPRFDSIETEKALDQGPT